MRFLVACPRCGRQYEASGLEPSTRFHCACGEAVAVPRPQPHDAAVVRCSSCGGPRQEGAPACGFCGADFTLHERDLHTICPGCMARVSDRARFCHHCATPLAPEGVAGEPTEHPCPACGPRSLLRSRRFGSPPVTVSECPRCAGLWLAAASFRVVLERARRSVPELPEARPGPTPEPEAPAASSDGRLYRPCPICGALMHRRNYGRRSGVIIDSCQAHGLWFDAAELDRVLGWVRQGGETVTRRIEGEELRDAERRARLARRLEPSPGDPGIPERGGWALIDALGWLLNLKVR